MSSEEELDHDDFDEEEDEVEEAPVEKKRKVKKGGKKKKDPNKPKRNMSAFFLYSNANRARIKEEHPDASFGDLVSAPIGAVCACLAPCGRCLSEFPFAVCILMQKVPTMGGRV